MYKTVFVLILIFVFASFMNAQEIEVEVEDDDWEDYVHWEWEIDQPLIEIIYGLGNPQHKKFEGDFAKTGLLELKLGYQNSDTYRSSSILEFNNSFFFVSNLNSKLSSESEATDKVRLNTWRFGLGTSDGYGYRIGKVAILPYNQNSFVWSMVKPDAPANITPSDQEILDLYKDTFRFGSLFDAGVKFDFSSFIALGASFEGAVVYPRHMFWQWAGSFIIEGASQGMLSLFIKKIMKASPEAGPVVFFLLKNGLSYAFYALRREKMNWPFNSTTPLTFETFKFGLTFTF